MSTGLLALLDDVAALVKVSAATIDDIPAQVAKTSGKVSGIVIDDAAVTPKYVVGLDPSRELVIIYHIAKRSLVNKLVFLAPAALVLGFYAPALIQPLLMLGGAYLCFEGYEKVHGMFHSHAEEGDETLATITPEELEKLRIASAVKTDFILSSEIVAISYATVATRDLMTQVSVLFTVAVGITIAVYGFVGLIVKMDDIGVYLYRNSRFAAVRALGRGIVKGMPAFLKYLGYIGTAAMLWVGAEIIAHGIPTLHHALGALTQPFVGIAALAWLVKVTACALGGLAVGFSIEKILAALSKLR